MRAFNLSNLITHPTEMRQSFEACVLDELIFFDSLVQV